MARHINAVTATGIIIVLALACGTSAMSSAIVPENWNQPECPGGSDLSPEKCANCN
ncbi:MAG: hypothetical protein LUO89_10510 [Methanothrix sp.]|nr:hypothetical protein [Methanothrix sp.]